MKRLSKEPRKDIAALAATKDSAIDLRDMPEVLDGSGAQIGRYDRPKKKPVTMRIDEDVVAWLEGYGRGYQTKANLLFRHAMISLKTSRRKRAN
jgi:uncharacterized protein (DUF4415 family)